jgi:hypothetical protein
MNERGNQGSEQQENNRGEVDLLERFAEKARQRGLSLFAYLIDIAPEDVGDRRLLSLE